MSMDIHQILKQLPHRYPFLLVDRVMDIEKGKSIKALKNVTMNEPYFTGHFPHRPVMPGVMMLEALAQEFRAYATGRKNAPQIFVTTHQPYFVDALSPDEVWILEI